jgi:uncharacterized protein (TIGR03000 family)
MFRNLVKQVAVAVLACGISLGTTGTAAAQSHHAGGHAGGSHSGHAGYHYGGHSYGGHNYYHGGYGYRYPGVRFGVNVGGLGYYGYGYSYPYYGYYPGAYYGATTYYAPSYYDTTVVPPTTSSYPPAEAAPPPATSNGAHITVQVPADARLWIDGQLTSQTGAVRTFETPALPDPGRTYSYRLRAEWTNNGQPVVRERTVEFGAGNQLVVNMTMS